MSWWKRPSGSVKQKEHQENPKMNMNIVEGVVEEDNKLEQDGGLPCSQGKGTPKRKYIHGENISYDSPSKRRRTNNVKVNLKFWKKIEDSEPQNAVIARTTLSQCDKIRQKAGDINHYCNYVSMYLLVVG